MNKLIALLLVFALAFSLCACGSTGKTEPATAPAIADATPPATQLHNGIPVASFPNRANNGISGNQDFLASLILEQQPIFCNSKTGVLQMGGTILLNLLHQNRPVPDITIHSQTIPHFDKVDGFPFHTLTQKEEICVLVTDFLERLPADMKCFLDIKGLMGTFTPEMGREV